MPFTVSRLQSHTFISKTKDEKSLSDKDQPFGNTKYLGIRYVMPGFISSNLIPVQCRCVTVKQIMVNNMCPLIYLVHATETFIDYRFLDFLPFTPPPPL